MNWSEYYDKFYDRSKIGEDYPEDEAFANGQ